MPKQAQPGEIAQKHLCVGYSTFNNLLPAVVKALSKAQCVLPLAPLPKIDESYAMLNSSAVYSYKIVLQVIIILLFHKKHKINPVL